MVTMIDELYDRHYRESRAELNSALAGAFARLLSSVGNAFEVLNRIEYAAPWSSNPTGAKPH
jgi:hypothetical protein